MNQNDRIHLFHLFFLAACLIVAVAGKISSAQAETLHVGGDPSNYSLIQAALDDAATGDIVFVHAGTYNENIQLKEQVTLQGEGADVTFITGHRIAGAPSSVVRANDIDNAVIAGFSIDISPAVAASTGIDVHASGIHISRCIIQNTETGIYAINSDVTIQNNVFYPESGTTGINIQDTTGVIKNNIIMNYDGTGISVTGRNNVSVRYNDVFQCAESYHGITGGIGAINSAPLFIAAPSNFHLTDASPCIDAGDPSDTVPSHGGTRIDMGAFEYEYQPEIVDGPGASVNSDSEVRIVWQTSTPCSSRVNYSMTAGPFDQEIEDSALAVAHSIILSGLSPSITYQYFVSSTDNGGTAVESKPAYFVTLPAPDASPPSLEVEIPGLITDTAVIHAAASDDTGIESMKFYVDDALSYTIFGDSCDWLFDPSSFSNGPHTLKIVTMDKAGKKTAQQDQVEVAVKPADISPPEELIVSPAPASIVSGGSVTVQAWGTDPESGIASFLFYIDNQLLHVTQINGQAGAEEHASWQWNSYGAENEEDHEIKVVFVNNANLLASEQHYVHVSNEGSILDEPQGPFSKYLFIKLVRGQVKRDGIFYEAKLYVQNLGPHKLYDVTVHDTHAGFQAIKDDYGYKERVHFDPYTFSSEVTYDIGMLMPGEIKECIINMSTVLVAPEPHHFNYVIGKKTRVTYKLQDDYNAPISSLTYNLPAVKTIEGWGGTEEIPLNVQTILEPVAFRDYLVVTHPLSLYSNYDSTEVDDLLSELALFVRHKNAVLGYLDSPAPRTELMNVIGHKNAVPVSGTTNTGGWSSLMHPSWQNNGYMLLVGEIEIIPSFTIQVMIPAVAPYTVPLSDQPYADLNDDGYTDLTLGRIIGNDAHALITPIMTSLGVQQGLPGYGFDPSNTALLISGMGNWQDSFVKNINDISKVMNNVYTPGLYNVKFHRTEYSDSQSAWGALQLLFPHRDIVYFDGHGSTDSWGQLVLTSAQLDDINFNDINPVVFALACSTGNYEKENDLSIAEAFLAHGAGIYIGATRMTNTGKNANNGLSYFRNWWTPWLDIGHAWRNLERSAWTYFGNWRFSLAYNIYGDPKFGVSGTKSPTALFYSRGTDADAPPEGISLDLPDYAYTDIGGVDYVEIPGGDVLSDPGQYQVPVWREEISIPPGYVVQDVDLVNRSGFSTSRGLNLPISPDDFMESDSGEPFIPAQYLWYPDAPFRWDVTPDIAGGDEGSTLVLTVYPFQYNTETKESRYYTHHEFKFSITESLVEIVTASVEKQAVHPGQALNILMALNNLGDNSQTAHLRAVIEPYAGQFPIGGLPIHTLELPPGHSAVMESWDTSGIPIGHYRLKLVLEDTDGNLLDTAADHFTIGSDTVDICYGDSEVDGDVDGTNLAIFIYKDDFSRLEEFAAVYGKRCN